MSQCRNLGCWVLRGGGGVGGGALSPPTKSMGVDKPPAKTVTFSAEALYILWLAISWPAAYFFMEVVKGDVVGYYASGPPRWRPAWGMPTQICVLPLLFTLAYRANGGSLASWCKHWQTGLGDRWSWIFIYLFPTWLMLDFVLCEVRALMVAHHVTCIVGHLIAAIVLPAGFPYYFAGVIALECGSFSCNVLCLIYTRVVLNVYLSCMTISNLFAVACMVQWCRAVRSKAGCVIAIFITVVLAALRQREAFKCGAQFGDS